MHLPLYQVYHIHFSFVSEQTGMYDLLQQQQYYCTAVLFRRGIASVPGGLVGGPRAYQDQFRGSKSHRVRDPRRDFFLHIKK